MTTQRRDAPVGEGELAAEQARQSLGLGLDAPISVLDAVEEQAGVPTCIQSFTDEIAGLMYQRRGRAYLFVNGDHPVVRQRFTLAHEYGHVAMGHSARVESATAMHSKDPQEVQANAFAGAFLAPRQAVRNWAQRHEDLDVGLGMVVRMSAFFGTSAEASRIRLDLSGVVSKTDSERLKRQIARQEHLGLLGSFGLQGFVDALSRLRRDVASGARTLPRLPSQLVGAARLAHEQDLLDVDDLATILRGQPVEFQPEDEFAG